MHDARGVKADATAKNHRGNDPRQTDRSDLWPKHSRHNSNGHADDAVKISASRCFLVGQAPEAQDKKDGCSDIGDRCQISKHIDISLLTEHGQHALGDGEPTEHIDGGKNDAADGQRAYPHRGKIT